MTCPDSQALVAYLEGTQPRAVADDLGTHVASCTACRAALGHLEAVRATLRCSTLAPDPQFVSEVMQRLPNRRPLVWFRALAPVVLGAAAASVLWLLTIAVPPSTPLPVARGDAAHGSLSQLGVEVFLHPQGQSHARSLIQGGEALHPGDGLSFVVHQPSGKSLYLCLFAVDAKQEVHWFYPAYLNAQHPPEALRLAPESERVSLPEGVVPEGVAAGPLQVVALFLDRPVNVAEVEHRLQISPRPPWKPALPVIAEQVQQLTSVSSRR